VTCSRCAIVAFLSSDCLSRAISLAVATAASCLFGPGTSDGILPIKDCLTLADELGMRDLKTS
jgi:hypothetical protein